MSEGDGRNLDKVSDEKALSEEIEKEKEGTQKEDKKAEKRRIKKVVFVTGLSGSGKTTVLKTLEDIGYYCIDNVPPELISQLLSLSSLAESVDKIAFGMGFRSPEESQKFYELVLRLKENLRKEKIIVQLVFLEASEDDIIKRYKETRRVHPIRASTIQESIQKEKEILKPIKDIADIVIDTTGINIHELKERVKHYLGDTGEFVVQLVSFGFRYGIPRDADLVFDVRFIRNPHFDPKLKAYDGTNKEVQKYVFVDENAKKYLQMIKEMLEFVLEGFQKEGKFVATVAIGCTGGRHRSVAFVEKIAQDLQRKYKVIKIHRDKDKESPV